jgi:ATP adenylyltransferase
MQDRILYSPWRLQYIISEKGKTCPFCIKQDGSADKEHLVVYRNSTSFVILNAFPYNNGHIMAVPNRHVAALNDLSKEEYHDLFEAVLLSEKVLKETYRSEGINVGINLGAAAGAGISEHLHVHLLPRWAGDTNFMTTIGGTRVIPEAHEITYSNLVKGYKNVIS